jgi:hypothetical protein
MVLVGPSQQFTLGQHLEFTTVRTAQSSAGEFQLYADDVLKI